MSRYSEAGNDPESGAGVPPALGASCPAAGGSASEPLGHADGLPAPLPAARAQPSLLVRLTSAIERLDWARVFPQPQPVEIELGSGDGSFLVAWARCHPERNFLGVERLAGRLRKLDRKGRRAGVRNVRGLRVEAVYFTEYLLPPGSVAACHVYFPDPWPKQRHAANRLLQPRFLAALHRALAAGGVLYLRTDHAGYFAQMLAVCRTGGGFQECATPGELAAVPTDFEREFAQQGVATLRAAFRKVSP